MGSKMQQDVAWQYVKDRQQWVKNSDTDFRLYGTNPVTLSESESGNNSPATSLNPETFEWFDHKVGQGGTILQYAKALGYELPKDHNGKPAPSEMWEYYKDKPGVVQKYLKTRGIEATEAQIKEWGLKVNMYKSDLIIGYAVRDLSGNIVQIQRIFIDRVSFKKIEKKLYGSGSKGDRCYIINPGRPIVVIFEGLEDGLTYLLNSGRDVTIIVCQGTSGLKHIASFLKAYPYVEFNADPDADNTSLKASVYMGVGVKRYAPTLGAGIDANAALQVGRFNEWLTSLREVPFEEVKQLQAESRQKKQAVDTSGLPFCFWYTDENKKLKINSAQLIDFLASEGYAKMPVSANGLQKILIQVLDNLVFERDISFIRNAILTCYLDMLPDNLPDGSKYGMPKSKLRKVLIDGINSYVEPAKLDALPVLSIDFLRDTKDRSFFFFRNGYAEVTAGGVKLRPYSELPGKIWASQRIDHDLTVVEDTQTFTAFSFVKFCRNVCSKRDDTGNVEIDEQRFSSLLSTIGYLLSNHNNPAYCPAVILSDASLDDNPQGGTGKGLLCRATGKMRKVTRIDGKNLKLDGQFALSELELDTQVVWIDDVVKRFPFERLFSYITETYSFEKKHQNRVSFTEANNPKTILSTNYSIPGEGYSHERRRVELELQNYYSSRLTPQQEFGELFLSSDWSEGQWNVFFNFMLRCCQAFLANRCRILPYRSETLEKKKLINEVGNDFLSFADSLERGVDLLSETVYSDYLSTLSDQQRRNASPTKFGLKLNKYCTANGLQILRPKKRSEESSLLKKYYRIEKI